ncbi:MAG TPA: epoxyqueuosine reductase, partial [Methanoregula sp.]|nr:epoxyqueuosine reductase [Methanoregula sp.]
MERFDGAPEGFHPRDIYSKTGSVLVFAKRVPTEGLYAQNCVPYTHVNTIVTQEVDRLAFSLSLFLEDNGMANVMVPSDDPYESWDPEKQHGRAILSLRHAGYFAGLGCLGKNNL